MPGAYARAQERARRRCDLGARLRLRASTAGSSAAPGSLAVALGPDGAPSTVAHHDRGQPVRDPRSPTAASADVRGREQRARVATPDGTPRRRTISAGTRSSSLARLWDVERQQTTTDGCSARGGSSRDRRRSRVARAATRAWSCRRRTRRRRRPAHCAGASPTRASRSSARGGHGRRRRPGSVSDRWRSDVPASSPTRSLIRTSSGARRHARPKIARTAATSGATMRILFASTQGAGHVGPLLPFARAALAAGHTVLLGRARAHAASCRLARLDMAPGSRRGVGAGLHARQSPGLVHTLQELFIGLDARGRAAGDARRRRALRAGPDRARDVRVRVRRRGGAVRRADRAGRHPPGHDDRHRRGAARDRRSRAAPARAARARTPPAGARS